MNPAPRGCLAFLAAPIAAAIAAGMAFGLSAFVPVFVFAFLIASLHVLLLAAPLYFWIEHYRRPTLGLVLLASALIGALPIFLILYPSGTLRDLAEPVLLCGLCGACGGLAFWLVLRPDRQSGSCR
jgi:hypothetical protein